MPFPLFLIPLAIGAAGAGGSIFSGLEAEKQGNSAARYAEDEARITRMNIRNQAKAEKAELGVELSARGKDQARYRAILQQQFAASGLNMSGTAYGIIEQQARADEFDNMEFSRAAEYRQQVAKTSAKNVMLAGQNQGNALRAQGKSARNESFMNAGMSLVGGGFGAFGGGEALFSQIYEAQGGSASGGFMSGFTGSTGFLDAGKVLGYQPKSTVGPYKGNYKL